MFSISGQGNFQRKPPDDVGGVDLSAYHMTLWNGAEKK